MSAKHTGNLILCPIVFVVKTMDFSMNFETNNEKTKKKNDYEDLNAVQFLSSQTHQ